MVVARRAMRTPGQATRKAVRLRAGTADARPLDRPRHRKKREWRRHLPVHTRVARGGGTSCRTPDESPNATTRATPNLFAANPFRDYSDAIIGAARLVLNDHNDDCHYRDQIISRALTNVKKASRRDDPHLVGDETGASGSHASMGARQMGAGRCSTERRRLPARPSQTSVQRASSCRPSSSHAPARLR